jgi:hypothetical protein
MKQYKKRYLYNSNKTKKFLFSLLILKLGTCIKRKMTVKLGILSVILIFNGLITANASLSAVAVNSIQGYKTEFFVNVPIIDKLGFNYKGTDYNEKLGNITSDKVKFFDKTAKLGDFVIKSYFIPKILEDDINGTIFDPNEPISSTIEYIWKDNSNKIIDKADYDNIACSHDKYTMPLKLEITLKDIKYQTIYIDSKSNFVSTAKSPLAQIEPLIKTYQIAIPETCL